MASNMPRYRFKMPESKSFQAKRRKHLRKIEKDRKKKVYSVENEIEALRQRLWPDFGAKKEDLQPSDIKLFKDLPISKKTLAGLTSLNYTTPTDIQRESLLFALKGHDILGAAKTGSGKTLAFLIPILETLFRLRYTPGFGLAALIISPTRELAYQSYDVLRKLGKPHHMAFGLAIGGMFLHEEAEKIQAANVLICTPGRLLQHFEQTPNFSADELKVLVLDEADKILELGFKQTMDNIIESLPRQRQTLLFSATQTKSVKSLARLSLKKPIYISAHEKAKEVTPQRLHQRYIVCEMGDKLDMLWSFLKSHHKHKLLVFLSSCKQVRYFHQALKKLGLGMAVLCIHGHMKQLQRVEAYEMFARKRRVIMLATDVAARGLDFPTVDWIVQLDKPENVDTYIHRVGRTARYDKVGEALLVLLPSEEEKMLNSLKKKKIPIVKMNVAKKKLLSVGRKLADQCASDLELKGNATKAFISSMKTLYVLDRESFEKVNMEAYAASLGLIQVPKLPFLPGAKTGDEDDEGDFEFSKKNHFQNKTLDFSIGDDDDDKDDDIYKVVKSSTSHLENGDNQGQEQLWIEEGKKAIRKKGSYKEKVKLLEQSKLVTFDEEGNPENEDIEDGINVSEAIERLKEEDKRDKEAHRKRIREEHREQRLQAKQERKERMMERIGIDPATVAVLGNPDDSDDNGGENDDENADGDDDDDEGPRLKRRKMDNNDNTDDDDDDDDDDDEEEDDDDSGDENEDSNDMDDAASADDDDDDDNDEDDDDDDDEEEDDDDDDSEDEEHNVDDLEQDEAAALALLRGKR